MHRKSKRCDLLLGFVLSHAATTACGGTPLYATSTKPVETDRRAPGITLDPQFAPPAANEPRSLVLTPPVDSREARRTVERFLDAVVNEDVTTLSRLLAPGALQQLGTGGEMRAAGDYWQKRLARLDYGTLRDEPLFRPEEVRLVRAEAHTAPGSLRLEPRQVAITMPIVTTHVGKARLFGPELTFVLSEGAGRLVLTRIIEDFQLL